MPETAASVITDILQELVVQGSEAPIEASESQLAIRYMNRFMFMLDANGVTLGYTEVSNLGDLITIPAGAIMGLIKGTAIVIANIFDVPVSGDLRSEASIAMRAMRRLAQSRQPTQMPCTMPIGSGNEGNGFRTLDHFYRCPDDEILTETSNSILLEDNT